MRLNLERRQISIPIVPILAAVCVVLIGVATMRIGRVSASEVGILINNLTGNIEVITQPGRFFYNGLTSDLHAIDKTRRTLKMLNTDGEDVKIKTSDGSDVQLDVEINYELLLDPKTIRTKVLTESGVGKLRVPRFHPGRRRRAPTEPEEAYQAKWIRDYSRAVVRYVFGGLTTDGFYDASQRDDKARQTERELNSLLQPHGVNIVKVVPKKFRFYEEYEDKIREKKEAVQEVEKQKQLAEQARAKQKFRETETTKEAEVEIERVKGALQKKLIAAEADVIKKKKEADAYAYTAKVRAEAEFFQAERQGKGILAAAKAEAEGLTNLVQALEGEGGRIIVMRALAGALKRAVIEGLPYATSPVVQKVSVENAAASTKR